MTTGGRKSRTCTRCGIKDGDLGIAACIDAGLCYRCYCTADTTGAVDNVEAPGDAGA